MIFKECYPSFSHHIENMTLAEFILILHECRHSIWPHDAQKRNCDLVTQIDGFNHI